MQKLLSSSALAAQPPRSDTIALEVGSKQVNARLYEPHAALVKVYVGDPLTQEWTNELTLGDSAGRKVMHWVTKAASFTNRRDQPAAVWYLIDEKPYMVYGEVPLPNGQVRRMTEVEIPLTKP